MNCRLPISTIVYKALNMAESNGKGSHNETSSGKIYAFSYQSVLLFYGPVHCRHGFLVVECWITTIFRTEFLVVSLSRKGAVLSDPGHGFVGS